SERTCTWKAGGCCWPRFLRPSSRCSSRSSFWLPNRKAGNNRRGEPPRIPMLDKVIFYFFAGIAVASPVLTVTRRNAVHSASFLITALLATAGIFLQFRAEFLFIVQIILYVVGLMVLIVFVIIILRLVLAVLY